MVSWAALLSSNLGGAWRIRTADPLPARQEQPSSTAFVRDQNATARVLRMPPDVALIVVLIVVQLFGRQLLRGVTAWVARLEGI